MKKRIFGKKKGLSVNGSKEHKGTYEGIFGLFSHIRQVLIQQVCFFTHRYGVALRNADGGGEAAGEGSKE